MYSDKRYVKKHGIKASFDDENYAIIEKICKRHGVQKGTLIAQLAMERLEQLLDEQIERELKSA